MRPAIERAFLLLGVVMREEYDRAIHGPYGDWLKSKSVQTRAGGWTHATHDQVLVDTASEKRVMDQLGNEVRQYGQDQQDVTINAPQTVRATIPTSAIKREITDVQQR